MPSSVQRAGLAEGRGASGARAHWSSALDGAGFLLHRPGKLSASYVTGGRLRRAFHFVSLYCVAFRFDVLRCVSIRFGSIWFSSVFGAIVGSVRSVYLVSFRIISVHFVSFRLDWIGFDSIRFLVPLGFITLSEFDSVRFSVQFSVRSVSITFVSVFVGSFGSVSFGKVKRLFTKMNKKTK